MSAEAGSAEQGSARTATTPAAVAGNSIWTSVFKDIVVPLAAYAYFAGWVYAYFFFSSYGVRLYSVDIPAYYFIVYAYSVFFSILGFTVIVPILVVVAFCRSNPVGLAIVLIIAFTATFYVARHEGIASAYHNRISDDGERVLLQFKAASSVVSNDLKLNNESERLRLLTETKDRIITFYQPPMEGKSLPLLLVYDVAKSDLIQIKRVLK